MSAVRLLWAQMKRRAPRLANLIRIPVLVFFRPRRAYTRAHLACVRAYDESIRWISRLIEGALAHAVEVQRTRGLVRGDGGNSVGYRLEAAAASLGIRYLDKRYRHVFQDTLSVQWDRWFGSEHFSGESIVLAIGTLGPGGSERQVVTTLLGLAAAGYRDLYLLCTYSGGQASRFYAHLLEGCPVTISELSAGLGDAHDGGGGDEALPCGGLKVLRDKLPDDLKDIACFARDLLARRPRIVHAWLDWNNVKAGLAAAVIGVPRIVLSTRSITPDNFPLFQPYMREAYRALAEHPTVCLLNNSEAGARAYEQWLGLPHGTFNVVRNGFDFSSLEPANKVAPAREFRARLGISHEAPLIGSVLRFSEEKRPLLWVDVAARVSERRPDVMFLMIGDGPLREETRRHAEACGLGDRIVMPGYEKDSASAIAAMDLFLLTSRIEGLPNVLVEAQALGVPVVTTHVGGTAETLVQGETGYAVFPHSADLLANAVLKILGNAPWRQAARKAASQFVRERFPVSRMLEGTLDAYFGGGEFAKRRDR